MEVAYSTHILKSMPVYVQRHITLQTKNGAAQKKNYVYNWCRSYLSSFVTIRSKLEVVFLHKLFDNDHSRQINSMVIPIIILFSKFFCKCLNILQLHLLWVCVVKDECIDSDLFCRQFSMRHLLMRVTLARRYELLALRYCNTLSGAVLYTEYYILSNGMEFFKALLINLAWCQIIYNMKMKKILTCHFKLHQCHLLTLTVQDQPSNSILYVCPCDHFLAIPCTPE